MKRKKSPLPQRRGGTSSDSNDSAKLSAHGDHHSNDPGKLSAPVDRHGNDPGKQHTPSDRHGNDPAKLSTHVDRHGIDPGKLSIPGDRHDPGKLSVHGYRHGNTSTTSHPPLSHTHRSPGLLSASSHLTVNTSDEWSNVEDANDGDGSNPSLGSHDGLNLDEADGKLSEAQRIKAAIEHVQQKIVKTKELIKEEQVTRDDNVNEYLKLATNADKQQIQRIKNVFEKKNQKSAQQINQLQKKLENYNKRIRDLETHGLPRGVLRDMGQNLKDVGANIKGGITGFSGSVMSKPREFAHLIKNKFGSADNINSVSKTEGHHDPEINIHGSGLSSHSTKYTSEDDNSSSESGRNAAPLPPRASSTVPSPHHHAVQPHHGHTTLHNAPSGTESTTLQALGGGNFDLEPILMELRSQRDEYQHLVEEIESVKGQIQQESTFLSQALHEERYRYERLEEQMNDLIELHQNEIENLKQGIADMEEKVQYQSEERLRDVHDVLDNCQTRISRMEHQQHQHLQQLVSLDAVENSQARALLLKLINVALTALQVVLLLVATTSNIIMPFLRTRVRTLTTLLLIFTIAILCHQWPELLELCHEKATKLLPPLTK